MVEATNELMLKILRDLQDGLAEVRRELAEQRREMAAGFARIEGDSLNFRYRTAALQVDYDQLRGDFVALRSRIVALERASRGE